MSLDEIPERSVRVEEVHEFDESPERVWRAITTPALREHWLPGEALASPEPVAATPNRDVSYRMREHEPPFLESTVTFRLEPTEFGGTRLRIFQELTDARLRQVAPRPANGNAAPLMRAA